MKFPEDGRRLNLTTRLYSRFRLPQTNGTAFERRFRYETKLLIGVQRTRFPRFFVSQRQPSRKVFRRRQSRFFGGDGVTGWGDGKV